MKQTERSQSVGAVVLGSVIVIVIILAGISTLDRFSQNKAFPAQPTGLPTTAIISTLDSFNQNKAIPTQSTRMPAYIESSTYTPNAGTQKAISHATWSAITRTPFPTQIPVPTGTFEGEEVKFSGEKLILDALNAWGG